MILIKSSDCCMYELIPVSMKNSVVIEHVINQNEETKIFFPPDFLLSL